MHRLLFLIILVVNQAQASPAQAVLEALVDARKLPAGISTRVLYLSLYNLPEHQRAEALLVFTFHANSLSREAEFVTPRLVSECLVRVTLGDYGWQRETLDKLAESDPFFHVQLDVPTEFGYFVNGQWVTTRIKTVRQTGAGPWLDQRQITELMILTQSRAPIMRLDWFVVQTAIQEGRKVGYYDVLGLKKRADFEALVGLDAKASKRVRKEIAAIVTRSSVALNNRQLVRFQSITGPYWMSLDAGKSVDKNNAVRLLNGDYQHEFEEIYGTLPNGLFAFYLSDKDGKQANAAPDYIATDSEAPGTDRRVHAGVSCIRCHVEGIRPIDDWARKTYRGPLSLASPDYEKLRRLKQLYLSDLDRQVQRDQGDYAETLMRCNGFTPRQNARAYARLWERYVEKDRTPADCARELGVSVECLMRELKANGKLIDPVLAGLLQDMPIRSEHWEEIYATAQGIMKGKK